MSQSSNANASVGSGTHRRRKSPGAESSYLVASSVGGGSVVGSVLQSSQAAIAAASALVLKPVQVASMPVQAVTKSATPRNAPRSLQSTLAILHAELEGRGAIVGIIDTLEEARCEAMTPDGRPDHRVRIAAASQELALLGATGSLAPVLQGMEEKSETYAKVTVKDIDGKTGREVVQTFMKKVRAASATGEGGAGDYQEVEFTPESEKEMESYSSAIAAAAGVEDYSDDMEDEDDLPMHEI